MSLTIRNLESRLAALARRSALHRREADILRDMARAERPEVVLRLDFLERYLPEPPAGPLMSRKALIASDAEIAAAQRRMKSDPISARLAEQLVRDADGYLRVGGAAWIDWRARRRPQLWNARGAHWKFAAALDALVWTWQLNGTQACAAAVKGILLAIARARHGWRPLGCNYGNPYQGWLNDNLLDMGHATLMPAIACHAVRPLMTRVERAEIVAYFEPFFYRALSHRYNGMAHPGHNFAPVGFGGVGLLALALWEDVPRERRAALIETLAWAEAYARFTLDTVGGSDGAAVEGSAYGSASLRYLALFAEGLRRRCGRDLFAHPGWGRFARYLMLETLPGGGAFNNFNDNHYATHTGFWPLVARRSGDAVADWVWLHHEGLVRRRNAEERGQRWSDIPYVLLFREPKHDALQPEAAGIRTVHFFKDQHHWVARTGWAPNDLHVSFQCTRGRAGGHQQMDRLNFTVYALGERFAIDSGYGLERIPGATEVRRLGKLPESHNQVLVDGKGQIQTVAANAGRIICAGSRGAWAWAVGDAVGAYEGLLCARRGILARRAAAAPVIVIVDRLAPVKAGAHRCDWLLHTAPDNRLILERGGAFTIEARRATLRCCQLSNGRRADTQDVWLGHPRLRLTTETAGREYLALTVMTAGRARVKTRSNRALAIEWSDSLGTGRAVLRRRGAGADAITEFAVEGSTDWIAL